MRMTLFRRAAPWALALVVFAGCASTSVTSREEYTGPKAPRPDRIIVRDFAGTPDDIAADTPMATAVAQHSRPQTAQEIALGRKLGAELATELAARIRDMGLPAVTARGQPAPRVGELVITGYFTTMQSGSEAERMVVGFGAGSAKLATHAEGWWMSERGLVRVGRGDLASGSGEMPGVAAPLVVSAARHSPIGLIVGGGAKLYQYETGSDTIEAEAKRTADEIAEKIRPKFHEQGWI
jgi:hypothetical protein